MDNFQSQLVKILDQMTVVVAAMEVAYKLYYYLKCIAEIVGYTAVVIVDDLAANCHHFHYNEQCFRFADNSDFVQHIAIELCNIAAVAAVKSIVVRIVVGTSLVVGLVKISDWVCMLAVEAEAVAEAADFVLEFDCFHQSSKLLMD